MYWSVFLRRIVQKRVLAGLFLLLCPVFLSYGNSYGQAGEGPKSPASVLESQAIARTIPSKPNDLFVVLKNGLTVLVRESHGSNVVSCQVMVKTGSIYEGARMGGGLSHYLEHVVSGGSTSKFTEAQISERVQAMGGATNANTSYARTVYYINTTRPHYEEALFLLLTSVTDCQFNEIEYEREKGVIVQEINMGENNPSRQLWLSFVKTAYRKHPVRYPIIGEKGVFLKMKKEDLVAHYRHWYGPQNLVISVAGNVDKEGALGTILNLTGNLRRGVDPPYVLPAEPRQLAPRRVETVLPMARLTTAYLGCRTISLADPDLFALDVLAVIMGDGRTSRLYQSVRDQKNLVLSISAWSWTPAFVEGQFTISMSLSQENLSQAVDAVWQELSDVRENLVSEEALERAINKVVAGHVFAQESVQRQAGQLASDWVSTGDPYFSDTYVSGVQQVTLEDMRRVARKYLVKDRMTLAVVKPPSAAEKDSASEPAKATESEIQKRVLPNQMTLLLKKNTAAPIVSFEFVAKGGLRFEPIDKPGLSHFMAGLLTKGTADLNKFEIAKTLEDLGGSIQASSGRNVVMVSVSVLKEHFDTALDLLADVVLHPSFPESEIEKQRHDTLMAIKKLDEQWASEVSRLFRRHYYRKHPYRNDVIGKAEAVGSFSQEDIRGFYQSVMMPNNAVLAVFGDIEPEDAAAMVEEAFEEFQPGILEQPIIEPETDNIREDETFETFNEKTSAAILVGYNGLALGDKDSPVVDVLDAIISGIRYPSGWLHHALRGGETSLVYYVHAYPAFGIDGGFFGVMTQTSKENYKEVLNIVLEQMALIRKKQVDATTLERAKNMCTTMHQMGLETIAAQATSSALNERLGLGYDYAMKYPALIKKVNATDVLRIAKKLLSHHLIVATRPKDG